MAAGTYDFTWDQGATFDATLTWRDKNETPVPLSGYTARMHLRSAIDSADIVLELTTENGRIELGGDEGTIHLIVTAEDMADIAAGTYRYDLEMVTGGYVRKLIKGKFKVLAEVTR
jgi:hypothetical protein